MLTETPLQAQLSKARRPHVSISQATALLGWTRREMSEAIPSGEVELMTTPLGKWFWREELMAKALETWPLEVVEETLGADADRVLPHALRTAELRIRLPRHHIAMLEYRAEQDRISISDILACELDIAPAPTPRNSPPSSPVSPPRSRGQTAPNPRVTGFSLRLIPRTAAPYR